MTTDSLHPFWVGKMSSWRSIVKVSLSRKVLGENKIDLQTSNETGRPQLYYSDTPKFVNI